tara:strand:+ start:274 stop:387 length:114 start_codon:yes stop_codon:yes gene_type:complete
VEYVHLLAPLVYAIFFVDPGSSVAELLGLDWWGEALR